MVWLIFGWTVREKDRGEDVLLSATPDCSSALTRPGSAPIWLPGRFAGAVRVRATSILHRGLFAKLAYRLERETQAPLLRWSIL